MQSRPTLGIAIALLAAGGYGFMPVLARMGFDNGVATWEAGWLRATVLIVAFGAVAWGVGLSLRVPRGAWPVMAALAAATALVSLSYLVSVEFIPVGLAAIIFYTYPVLVLLASPLLEGRRLGLFRLGVTLLAFVGLTIAIGPSFGDLDLRGILFAGLAAVTGAAQLFAGRRMSARMPPLAFGLIVHLLIWPALLLAALWWNGGSLRMLTAGAANETGYLAAACLSAAYVLTYFAHMKCLSYAPASTVAPFFNLEPVTTMLLAAAILGERLVAHQYFGGGMVLLALFLAGFEARVSGASRHDARHAGH